MQKTAWAAWALTRTPLGELTAPPPDLLADGEGAGYFLPKNPTLALGLSGLA